MQHASFMIVPVMAAMFYLTCLAIAGKKRPGRPAGRKIDKPIKK